MSEHPSLTHFLAPFWTFDAGLVAGWKGRLVSPVAIPIVYYTLEPI